MRRNYFLTGIWGTREVNKEVGIGTATVNNKAARNVSGAAL
jgi:hypothetical protein